MLTCGSPSCTSAREDWPAAVAALHAGMGRGSLTDAGAANLLMGVALYAQGQFDEARAWFEQGEPHREPRRSKIDRREDNLPRSIDRTRSTRR